MSTAVVIGPGLARCAGDGVLEGVASRVRPSDEPSAARTRALREWFADGVDTLLLVERAFPVRTDWAASGAPFALVADHINLTGDNPLVGPNADEWGPRFPDLTDAWDPGLRRALRRAAVGAGIALREGVLAGVAGSGRTASELSMLRMIGAEMAGEGFVHEAIVARHAGRRVAGIAILSTGDLPEDDRRTRELIRLAVAVLRSAGSTAPGRAAPSAPPAP